MELLHLPQTGYLNKSQNESKTRNPYDLLYILKKITQNRPYKQKIRSQYQNIPIYLGIKHLIRQSNFHNVLKSNLHGKFLPSIGILNYTNENG